MIADILIAGAEKSRWKFKIGRNDAQPENENEKRIPLRCEILYIVIFVSLRDKNQA